MKKGDIMPGRYACHPECGHDGGGWTYVGEQQLRHGWATLANCPRCHSSRVVGEVRDGRRTSELLENWEIIA